MLKARSRTVDVFLSHSAADKKLAERLSRGLDAHGLSVWLDRRELTPGSDLRREIEEAIQKADHILLLIGHREPDEAQQLTWRVALEAVWQDPEKRFIPVLHHGADLPAFVVSGSSSREAAIPVVRIEDGRNLREVVDTIVEIVKGEPTQKAVFKRGEDEVRVKEAERSHRLLDIRRYALSLK
jgi:hypothetical protein